MKRLTLTLTLLLAFAGIGLAQEQASTQPDRWRGLILDEATPEDAIRVLGRPARDHLSPLSAQPIDSWLTSRRRERIFRTLQFNNPQGVKRAWLSFLDDKLVSITIELRERVAPSALGNLYGLRFVPVVDALTEAFHPRDIQRHEGQVYPRTYPTVYHLVAVSDTSFVAAMIGNVPSFGGAIARSMGVPDQAGTLPGKVQFVQLVSRTLENRDGADVLR